MLNKFPLWKNLLIAVIILLGFFYALPNLYGEDPALQISGTHGIEVDSTVSSQVQTFEDTGILTMFIMSTTDDKAQNDIKYD